MKFSGHPSGHDSVPARRNLKTRARRPILVVDDDDDVRLALTELLRQEGFTAVEACNGREALDYLLAAPTMPSLILLDLNMPVMSGWEVLRAVRSHLRFADLPIILVTGERTPTDPANREIVGRLSKPFDADDLLALVRQHVVEPPAAGARSRAAGE